jgi:hypothetical protein
VSAAPWSAASQFSWNVAVQGGPACAERGCSFGHLALDDLPLAERRAHISRRLDPG